MATITLYKTIISEFLFIATIKKYYSNAHFLHFRVLKTLEHANPSVLLNSYTKSTGINQDYLNKLVCLKLSTAQTEHVFNR